jgi:hypothetical protein
MYNGPFLEINTGTRAEYERQIGDYGFSNILARLACVDLQAGQPFSIDTGWIGVKNEIQ